MYYIDIFEEAIFNYSAIEKMNDEELRVLKERWDKYIDENEVQLLSFGKKVQNLPIELIVSNIEKLIEVRGRMMFAVLRRNVKEN
jgi:hypothetical protein